MKFDVEKLVRENLLEEYEDDEISEMLHDATIAVNEDLVTVTYRNKVVDTFSIECKIYLKHIPKH